MDKKNIRKEILARIIEAKNNARYTNRGLVDAMEQVGHGISGSSLNAILSGHTLPSTEKWIGMALALKVSLDWLVLGENEKSNEAELTKAIIQHWVDYSENWTIQ